MTDLTIKHINDMDSAYEGSFVRARASLGVTSFGMQVMVFPPHFDDYPNHDHVADAPDNQEEVYTVLSGSAVLVVGGQEHRLEPGVFARVGAAEKRKIVTRDEPVQLLCLGGVPGQAYARPEWSEAGAPPPGAS